MPSNLFWNLAILFSNSSLGSEKLKQNRHSLIKSVNDFKKINTFQILNRPKVLVVNKSRF